MTHIAMMPHVIHTTHPLNMGPTPTQLRQHPITSNSLFYVRNHGNIPDIWERKYRLEIDGLVERQLYFSIDHLKRYFRKTLVTATLTCAGNRRTELDEYSSIPDEVLWNLEGISTAVWGGVPLCYVLAAAGVRPEAQHVALTGLDTIAKNGEIIDFGASIPLDKAMSKDVLLAYEMNGEPLPPEHGFPLRLIVPGYIGARSVKWLGKITLQTHPSDNYYQAHAYKLFPPHVTKETVDWAQGRMLDEVFLNSVICTPENHSRLLSPDITLKGFAISNNGLDRVEVSTDGGWHWQVADLTAQNGDWAWTFWELPCQLERGTHELVVRAFDAQGLTQPASPAAVWNFKGYMNNAWHRVYVTVG